eukprot:scaffold8907_cov105-Isochrysis_galbana.AAC.3
MLRKLGSLSSSVTWSHASSDIQPAHGLAGCCDLSNTWPPHLEGEEQLVHLEECPARRPVDEEGVVFVERLEPLLQVVRLGRLVERLVEQADVGVERELVHRVDPRQVRQQKVEDGRTVCARPVALPRGVDLLLGLLGHCQLRLHLVGGGLGRLQREDQLLVVQQRARRLGEHAEDGVLELDQLALARGHRDHQVILLHLELGPLLAHDDAEQLVLEALLLDAKVDQARLGRDLGRVVRVGQLGGQVEAEVRVVVHLFVAQPYDLPVAYLDHCARHDGLQRRVELLLDLLHQHRLAKGDGVLEGAQIVGLLERHHLEPVGLLHVADPLVGLLLRVNHQRPAGAARDGDAILGREGVGRQALDVPVAHVLRVGQKIAKVKVFRAGDREPADGLGPVVREQHLPVVGIERPAVREEGGGQQAVAHQVGQRVIQRADGHLPPRPLATQAIDELGGPREHHLEVLRLLLQLLLVVDVGGVLVAQRRHPVRDLLDLGLRFSQLGLLGRQRLHRGVELGPLGCHLLGDAAVNLHRADPHAQRLGRLGHVADHLGVKLGQLGDGVGQPVLVKRDQLHQKVGVAQLPLGLGPFGLRLAQDHHRLQHHLDRRRWLGVGLDLGHVLLVEQLQRGLRRLKCWERLVEVALGVVGDLARLDLVLHNLLRLDVDLLFLLVDDALLLHDDHQHLLAFDRRLGHNLLLLLELDRHLGHLHRRVRQLLQAVLQLVGRVTHLLALLDQQLAIALDQLQIVLLLDPHVLQKLERNLLERVGRPVGEPVDGGARDERREHAHIVAVRLADGRHAEHNVQVRAGALNKELPHRVVGRRPAGLLDVGSDGLTNRAGLVGRVQTRHLASREHAVDVLEKRVVDDLRVIEEEDGVKLLQPRQVVHLLQVLAEELRLVPPHHLDGEDLELGDIRRQPGQRLPAGAADADEHGMPVRHAEDALDAANVADGVGEADQVHPLRARLHVVVFELLLHKLLQAVRVGHLLVRRFGALGRRDRHEVAELRHDAVLEEGRQLDAKGGDGAVVDNGCESRMVGLVGQAVAKDAVALVAPQPDDGVLGVVRDLLRLHHALHHPRDVAQVEGVVRLVRGGQQVGTHLQVDFVGCAHYQVAGRLDILAKVDQVRID